MNHYQTETPTDGLWKFVKVNGQYRWLGNFSNHFEAVKKGEKAEAAGLVSIFASDNLSGKLGYWRMYSAWSDTLNIGCGQQEIDELKQIFQVPYVESY